MSMPHAAAITAMEDALRRVSTPLPGSRMRENRRPINITAMHDRWRLLDVLVDRFPHISAAEWAARCDAGRMVDRDGRVCGRDLVVRAGNQLEQRFPAEVEPAVAAGIRVVYLDEVLWVVDKPAPLPMHASGRYHFNTLQHLMNLACAPETPKPAHRLDANTTGLVVFARTRDACAHVQRQFANREVEKIYLARVHGHPEEDEFVSDARISTVPGPLGTHSVDRQSGRDARTRFRVLERRDDGTSLVEAQLETGRTNQIRIHLWALNHALLGDLAYLPDRRIGHTQTATLGDPPLQLHAWKLTFRHPLTEQLVPLQTDRPAWV